MAWPAAGGTAREPRSRLSSVDAVIQVVRGRRSRVDGRGRPGGADYTAGPAWRCARRWKSSASRPARRRDWLAVTGIGAPTGIFDMLQAEGVRFSPRAFATTMLSGRRSCLRRGVLMTEKDAVNAWRCRTDCGPVEPDVAPKPDSSTGVKRAH